MSGYALWKTLFQLLLVFLFTPSLSNFKFYKFLLAPLQLRLYTRACRVKGRWGVGVVTTPPTHTLKLTHTHTHTHNTHTFLRFVGIFTKCVGKISWHNVVGKFGEFYHKRNTEFYQYLFPQKSNFYWRWRLLNKLYKICSDDYDNNEYLTVEYIRFFTSDSI